MCETISSGALLIVPSRISCHRGNPNRMEVCMYSIIYHDRVIGHTWFPLHIGDKYKSLTVYEVDYAGHYMKVR